MGKENPLFNRRESGFLVPNNSQITSEGIARIFDIDLRGIVVDKLKALEFLPDGHELTFFNNGREHKDSQALYLVEEPVGKHMIFVSFLSPNSKTTVHRHEEPLTENYYWLAGKAFLRLEENVHELRQVQELIKVPPNSLHQLTTREEASLVLIVLENAALVHGDRLHKYQ